MKFVDIKVPVTDNESHTRKGNKFFVAFFTFNNLRLFFLPRLILIINLLFVLVEHAVNVHIGGNCERDAECIKNAFCRGQQNCLCDPYYSPSPDKSLCIASEC